MSGPRVPAAVDIEWLATSELAGRPYFRVGRRREGADELVAEWIGIACLVARRDGSAHALSFEEGVSPARRRKLAGGDARMLLHHLAGGIALHASAVSIDGRAIALVGSSGHGKSTLAAALCRQRGARLLADDAVILSREGSAFVVEAGESDHWLTDEAVQALACADAPARDAREDKVPVPGVTGGTAPLGAIVVLEDFAAIGEPDMRRVGAVDGLARLLPHLARFVLDSPSDQRAELGRLEELLGAVPVHVLTRPRGLEHLGAAVDIAAKLCFED